jgi:putative inorganic carbon (HCO3(-)) transporter
MTAPEMVVSSGHSLLERARVGLIVALLFLLPFFSGSTQYLGIALSELLLLGLACVAIAVYWLSGRKGFLLSRFEVLGLLVFAATMLSSFAAPYGIDAWHYVGALLLLAIGYRAARSIAEKDSYIKTICISLLASGVVQSLFAVHQYFFIGWYRDTLPGYFREYLAPNLRDNALRAVGGFIDPNLLSAFLNICFALALALLLFGALRLPAKIALIAASLLFLFAIALTGSKAGMGVTLLIAAALLGIRDKRLLAVIVLIIVLLIAIPNPARDQYIRALTSDPYFTTRIGIWSSSLQMAVEHPLIGVGPANYIFLAHRYQPETPQFLVHYSHLPTKAHNSYLHAFAETGLIGLVPLLLMVAAAVLAFRATASSNRLTERPAGLRAALIGFSIGVSGLLVHALVHDIWHNRCLLATSLFLFAAIAAWLAREGGIPFDPFERRYRVDLTLPKRALPIVTIPILVIGFALAQIIMPLNYEVRMQEIGSRIGTATVMMAEAESADPSLNKQVRAGLIIELNNIAAELENLRNWYPANAALLRYLGTTYRELFRATGNVADFTRAVNSFKTAEQCQPGRGVDAFQQLNTYIELVRWGYPKTPEIIETLDSLARHSIEQWPQRATFYLIAANVQSEKGPSEIAKAIELTQKAIDLEPNYLLAIQELGGLAVRAGDQALAARAAKLYLEAQQRIAKGPAPAPDDSYAIQILSPPRR